MQSSIRYLLMFTLLLCNSSLLLSQNKSESQIARYYDETVGEESLDIFNGRYNYPYYKSSSDTIHPFLGSKNFENGIVLYNNQQYDNVVMKYDVVKDNIVVKPKKKDLLYSLVVDSDKIDFFIFNKKRFINSKIPAFKKFNLNGFYEEKIISENIKLLVKYKKKQIDVIYTNKIYNEFELNTSFFIIYKDELYSVNKQKEIYSVFPDYKNEIKKFYIKNKTLEKYSSYIFKINLLSYLDELNK